MIDQKRENPVVLEGEVIDYRPTDQHNCIWRPRPLKSTPKSRAGKEILKKKNEITRDEFKAICRKHKVKFKSIMTILGWSEERVPKQKGRWYKVNK